MARVPAELPDRFIQPTCGHSNYSVNLFHEAFSPAGPRKRLGLWTHHIDKQQPFLGILDHVAVHVAMPYLITCREIFLCVEALSGPGHMTGHEQELCDGQKNTLLIWQTQRQSYERRNCNVCSSRDLVVTFIQQYKFNHPKLWKYGSTECLYTAAEGFCFFFLINAQEGQFIVCRRIYEKRISNFSKKVKILKVTDFWILKYTMSQLVISYFNLFSLLAYRNKKFWISLCCHASETLQLNYGLLVK